MKLLSVILSLILIFQVMPAGVFANEISEEELVTVAEEVTETTVEAELAETEMTEETVVESSEAEDVIEEVPAETAEEISEELTDAAEETAHADEETLAITETEMIEETTQTEEAVPSEETVPAEEETAVTEEETEEENEEAAWNSYTLYNYISVNNGKSYVSLNTQENGISAPKTAAEFHRENGNKRYNLSASEYEIADYDLTSLVFTTGGFSFVEQSVAKEGQPYFIARLDRVEAVAAANFRASSSVKGIESFTSLDSSNITFHRNWYLTLVTPMTNNKLLTGVRLGDGKNGNGDGKYYGLAFTENFQAVDSRFIPFGTKLSADQYSIADYDFTDLTLEYKGETYAYRPNGPVAGDGKDFHYYTVSFMKVDKLNKSTYGGGYLAENWPAWGLINSSVAGKDGYPYQEGYYHRDYQATLMVADAPEVIEEAAPVVEEEPVIEENTSVVEEIAPATEEEIALIVEGETVIEETAPVVEEEPVIEEIAPVIEEEAIVKETESIIEEDTAVEEIDSVVEAGTVAEETATVTEEEPVVEETAPVVEEETVAEEIESVNEENAAAEEFAVNNETPAAAEIAETYSAPYSPVVRPVEEEQETVEETQKPAAPARPIVQVIEETLVPMAAPEEARNVWALVNLLSMALTAFISLFMMINSFNADKVDNDESESRNWSRFLGIIPAAAAFIAFVITENHKKGIVFADKWTPFMIMFLLVDGALALLSRKDKEGRNA